MMRSPIADTGRRPYVRPMKGWWRRNNFYVEYMLHEATAIFVAAYALVLLIGLVQLSRGEAAWNAWLRTLKTSWAIGFHAIALIAVSYHAWTWFRIMPRTLPPVVIKGRRLPAVAITGSGLAAIAIVSLIMLVIVWSTWA